MNRYETPWDLISRPDDPPHTPPRFRSGIEGRDLETGIYYRYEQNHDGLWHWVVSEHVSVSRMAMKDLIAAALAALPLLEDYVQGRPEVAEQLRQALKAVATQETP